MTAEEFLIQKGDSDFRLSKSGFFISDVMIEFAKLHVTEALTAASEKVQTKEAWWQDNGSDDGFYYTIVDSDSILSAYPLDLIK